MKASFIFGGNTGMTYDQIQKQRDIANELLRANMYTPQNVGEGLSAIGRALAAKAIDKRTSRADEENRKAYEARRSEIFGMLGGGAAGGGGVGYSPSGTWTPAPPPPKPTDSFMGRPDAVFSGGNSFNLPATPAPQPSEPLSFGSAVMTPQEMLIEGAKARGLDPIDVATAISYETGGKFDPMIAGPTTQWGTHKGLIQFGEPQAQQHGVDFSSPEAAWRSQLDPKTGAVWSYLDSTGVQPGMGLDQIYSAINAGGINRFGASDANNGGAPGTVADKVAGMGPHREKAAQFLGGTWTPTGGQPVGGGGSALAGMPNPAILMALAETAGSPYASESDKMIAQVLMDQTIQAMDPMRQMEMEKARRELDQMRNPQPGFRNMTDEEEIAAGLDPSGVYQQGREGNIVTVQAPAKPAEDPTSVREYNFYAQQEQAAGRPVQSFDEWKKDNAKAGASSTTVFTGENSSAFTKKTDEAAAARFDGYVQAGANANKMMGDINALVALAPMVGTGKEAQVRVTLGPIAEAFGIDVEGLGEAEAFQSIVDRMAPQMRTPGAGSSSDFDARQFLSSLPQLGRSPEGNQIITQTLTAVQQYQIAAADLASRSFLPTDDPNFLTWQEAEKQIRALGDPYTAFNEFKKSLPKEEVKTEGMDFSKMSAAELSQIDINTLTPAQMEAMLKRFDEVGQ